MEVCGSDGKWKVICGSDGKWKVICGSDGEWMGVADTVQKQQESAVDRMDADSVGEVKEVAV